MDRWRHTIQPLLLACLMLGCAFTATAGTVNADGLYEQPWFLQSFLELDDDWREAAADGKHFAILWELKGCPACRRLHETLLSQPALAREMARDFSVLQLNFIGSRRVTTFQGDTLAERALARRFEIAGTPTLQIFAAAKDQAGPPREVLRVEGVPDADSFLTMLQYVSGGAYRRQSLPEYQQATAHPTKRPRP